MRHTVNTFRFSAHEGNLKSLKEIAGHYLAHEFNILGSGWRRVHYGMHTEGFEGKNFSTPWSVEEAIAEIPAFHREVYKRLSGLIERLRPGYVPIDWQIDFKSGARFSAGIHHKQLKYGVVEGVDAKVSADLGRLYQLVPLARAFLAFRDGGYKEEMLAQLLDFIAFNPPEYGSAWRANMNVSIRAANMVVATETLGDEIDDTLKAILLESLAAHGDYIMGNLEFPEHNFHPNHFIANLAGLLMVSSFLAGRCEKAAGWRAYALKATREQIVYQSYKEGTNFEGATSYHCLVLEMLAGSLVNAARLDGMASANDIRNWLERQLGKESFGLYKRMFSTYKDMLQPDGLIPLIGDNDSGRFLYLEGLGLDARDYRFLLAVGAELFDDNSLATEFDERHLEYAESLLGCGVRLRKSIPSKSVAMKEAGFYVMRDGRGSYAFINCGPVGTLGKGGHSHNDKLAFTLMLDGLDVFVDPGIYTYTASEYFRNAYRSVKAHNTLCLDGAEQNTWGIANQWWGILEETKCECLEWTPGADKDIFRGLHHAYERLPNGATHQRALVWDKAAKEIAITDELLNPKGPPPASECGFMLSAECIIVAYEPTEIRIRRGPLGIGMKADKGIWKTEPTFISPNYGSKIYTQRLVLKLPARTDRCEILISY